MAAVRILLCGDVRGQFDQLFKRVTSVSKASGPFDALLCVGQFFPDDPSQIDQVMELVDGNREIPLPTYFIGEYGDVARKVLSSARRKAKEGGLILEGVAVCKNLYWLKGSGILHLKGLRVAYLAGKDMASVYQDAVGAESYGAFHEDDVDALRAFADESDVNDLFLSNEWPQGVLNGISVPIELETLSEGSSVVAELVAELKPRYHIAGTEGIFYARDPYRNENASHVTRFVGLAAVGNAKKQKFLHALSLTPSASIAAKDLTQQPANTTKYPYAASSGKSTKKNLSNTKPTAPLADDEGQYWRYSASNNKKGASGNEKMCFEFMLKGSCSRGDACHFRHERTTEKPLAKGVCFDFATKGKCSRSDCRFHHNLEEDIANSENMGTRSSTPCWFCLASPNVDTDLVIDIGDHCYCAMAKGGLVDGHVLLLPIEHVSSMLMMSNTAVEELSKYKKTLRRLYKSQGKAFTIFERCIQFKGGTHAHIQVVPIPLSKASQVRSGFVSAAKELGFSFNVICPAKDDLGTQEAVKSHVERGRDYFFVELPEGTILVHVLESGESVPVQFGREVCAKILGVPERSDWRACKLSKDEERSVTEKFKSDFSGLQNH